MDPLVTMGIISAAGSLLSGLVGAGSQASANAKNMELAEYQFDKNVEMWNMMNKYNLPINQMERLRAAGLNPNLVYGSQAVTGNTQSNAPQYQAPHINPTTNGGFISDAVNHGLRTPIELANLQSQTSANEALSAMRVAQRVGQDLENKMKSLDYHRASQLYQNSLDMADASLREMQNRADVRQKEAAIKDFDLELKQKYAGRLSEAQINKLEKEFARLAWDLDLEQTGRIKQDGSISNWLIDQVNRLKNGQPNFFGNKVDESFIDLISRFLFGGNNE